MRRRAGGVVIEESVEVRRPVEEVFDYCTDIAHEPEWNPHTRYAEKLTDGPVREGTRYKAEWVEGDPMIVEYVAVDRPRSWLTTGRSRRLVTTGEGHVVPTDDGARLNIRMVLEPRGVMSMISPVLGRVMRRRERDNLRSIKAVLESPPKRPRTPVRRASSVRP
jgi:uncharacterized protein YndB with AHSA1/START domain